MAIDPGLRRLALRTLLAVFPGTAPPDWAEQLLADGLAGYTLYGTHITDPDQLRSLTARLRAVREDVLVAVDEEGGDVTRLAHATGSPYPGNAALGVVDDPDRTRRIHHAIGADLAAAGFNLNFAPTVDVNTADDNPIIGTRSFGSDPELVARHGAAAVAGLQAAGVAACAKHFPGHGATAQDSHRTMPTVNAPMSVLRSRDLPPFAAAVAAGARAVMTAHIRVPELTGDQPATFSPAALGLLRADGFDGAIISDALEMAGAAETAGGLAPAAVRSLAAGADLLCLGGSLLPDLARETKVHSPWEISAALIHEVADALAAAVADGEVPAARLEQAAARVAALAAPLPAAPPPPDGHDLAYQTARRAIRIDGSVPRLVDPLVIQIESGHTAAEGAIPWGLAPHLSGVRQLDPATTSAEQLAPIASDRAVVIVVRHLHRCGASRTLSEKLAADHPTVVAEMGWPSRWRPAGARAFITTHGASYANGAALASVLFGKS